MRPGFVHILVVFTMLGAAQKLVAKPKPSAPPPKAPVAAPRKPSKAAKAPSGGGGNMIGSGGMATVDKPLKVMGQTRTLSMMLVLKNKKEKIDFINVRQNYHD